MNGPQLSDTPVGDPVFRRNGGRLELFNDRTGAFEPFHGGEYSDDEEEYDSQEERRQSFPSSSSSMHRKGGASFDRPVEHAAQSDPYAHLSVDRRMESAPKGQGRWDRPSNSDMSNTRASVPRGVQHDHRQTAPHKTPIPDLESRISFTHHNGKEGVVYRPSSISSFKYEFCIPVFYSVVMPDDGSSVLSSFDAKKIVKTIKKELLCLHSQLDEDRLYNRVLPSVKDAFVYAVEVSSVTNTCPYAVSFASMEHEHLNSMLSTTGDAAMFHVGPSATLEPRHLRDLTAEFHAPHQRLLGKYQGMKDLSICYKKERNDKYAIKYDSIMWAIARGFENFHNKWIKASKQRDEEGWVHNISGKWVDQFEKAALVMISSKLKINRLLPYHPREVNEEPQCLTLKFTPDMNRTTVGMDRSIRDNLVTVSMNVYGCIPVPQNYSTWKDSYNAKQKSKHAAPAFVFMSVDSVDKYHAIALKQQELNQMANSD